MKEELYIGARVRIHFGQVAGQTGTIYNCDMGRPAPWHVRPDSWGDVPGIALRADEIEILAPARGESEQAERRICPLDGE